METPILFINDSNFVAQVLTSRSPIYLYFYDSRVRLQKEYLSKDLWLIAQTGRKYGIKFGAVDVSGHPQNYQRHQIKLLPLFIIFKNGRPVARSDDGDDKDFSSANDWIYRRARELRLVPT